MSIMSVLSASAKDPHTLLCIPQFRECLKIQTHRSEVEFLHGFEACPVWSLERAVEMTAEYLRRKEDAKFEDAFAKLEC
jgi:hypothetical protein